IRIDVNLPGYSSVNRNEGSMKTSSVNRNEGSMKTSSVNRNEGSMKTSLSPVPSHS
ncbi:hypothetical protein Dimus_010995, partial [Dionaea muscipula]